MKIFWVWQSDTPGKIGRHFVRSVLDEVVIGLKAEIEEIQRPGDEELHLDHDTKNTPGFPALFAIICEKIEKSEVVVCDLTLTGSVSTSDGRSKKSVNSNVAVEFGYALKALGSERIVGVINEAFGLVNELPFDLAHRGGAKRYHLNSGATGAEIAAARKQLKAQLCFCPQLSDCAAHWNAVVAVGRGTCHFTWHLPRRLSSRRVSTRRSSCSSASVSAAAASISKVKYGSSLPEALPFV